MNVNKLIYLFEKDRQFGYDIRREFIEAYQYYCGGKDIDGENILVSTLDFLLAQKIKAQTTITMSAVQKIDRTKSKLANQILLNVSNLKNFAYTELECIRDLIISAAIAKIWFDDEQICRIERVPLSSVAVDDYNNPTRIHVARSMYMNELPKTINPNTLVSDNEPYDPRVRLIESWIKQDGRWHWFVWQQEGACQQMENPYGDEHPYIITPQKTSLDGKCYGLWRHLKRLQQGVTYYENMQQKMLIDRIIFEIDAAPDVTLLKKQVDRGDNLIPVKNGAIQNGKLKFLSDKSNIYSEMQKNKKLSASSISGIGFDIFNSDQTVNNQNVLDERSLISELGTAKMFGAVEKFETDLYSRILKFIKKRSNVNRYVDATQEELEDFMCFDSLDLKVKLTPKTQSSKSSMAYWAEIYKATTSVAPELAQYIVELILSDSDNPKCDEILATMQLQKEQQQQQQQQQQQDQTQQQAADIAELEKMKIMAEIDALKADTAKKMSQADLLQVNTVIGIENTEDTKQQKRLVGGGTIDTRS